MKYAKIYLLVLALAVLSACQKEDPPRAAFESTTTASVVGETIDFTITGEADFWAFWPGAGESTGINIEEDEFQHTYLVPGTYNAVLVASNLQDDNSILRDSALIQITVTDNDEKLHTRFSAFKLDFRKNNFAGYEDKNLKFKLDGIIDGNTVTLEVPNSSILDEMRAIFSAPATSKVYVGNEEQETGWTQNDFNSPVEYRIVAADGSEEINTVTVNRLPKSTNSQLMSFGLSGLLKGISYTTEQEGDQVMVTLSDSTGLTALKPSFTINDFARAYVDGIEQISDKTITDFSSEVLFNVTAEDATSSDYYINVQFQPVLVRFWFGEGNPFVAEGIFNDNQDTLFVNTPPGSDLTALVPSFTIRPYDGSLALGGVLQESGESVTDFSSPLPCRLYGDIYTDFIVVVN